MYNKEESYTVCMNCSLVRKTLKLPHLPQHCGTYKQASETQTSVEA